MEEPGAHTDFKGQRKESSHHWIGTGSRAGGSDEKGWEKEEDCSKMHHYKVTLK